MVGRIHVTQWLTWTHWQWILVVCEHRLQISSLTELWIQEASLTGSIPQEVRESVVKKYQTGLGCGRIGVALYFGGLFLLFYEYRCVIE
jgi:hypothetical protein